MATRKTPSAQSFAAEAQRQFDELKSALQAARASLASINRGLHVPVIKTPRHKIPGSTSGPSFLDVLGETVLGAAVSDAINPGSATKFAGTIGGARIAASFSDDAVKSFNVSSSQTAGQLLDAVMRGQRVR